MSIRGEIANFCRIMRAEGKLHRVTPGSDADEIISFLKSQMQMEIAKEAQSLRPDEKALYVAGFQDFKEQFLTKLEEL